MKRRTELLGRLYLCFFLFALVALLLVYKSLQIGVIEGEKWRSMGLQANIKTMPLQAERGRILADDGSPLASSQPFFDIRMDPNTKPLTDEYFADHVDSLAWYLHKHVDRDKSPSEYAAWLKQKRASGSRYIVLQNGVNYDQMEKFKTFPILKRGQFKGGLIIERQQRRLKTFKQLAARTIGIPEGNRPSVGLENYYNEDLTGKEGQQVVQRSVGDVWIPVSDVEVINPRRGADVKTTINIGLQDAAHTALERALRQNEADKGVAIVMEVETGAIKAIVNLRANGYGYYQELYNDAVGTPYEPGSTIKLASVMALLEDGYANKASMVDVDGGVARFYDRTLRDASPHGMQEIDLQKVFEKSSNVGIAKLVTQHYRGEDKEKTFVNRFKQFQLHKISGVDIKGEGQPLIKDGIYGQQDWFGTSLPWMSCGYELTMTPLQVLNLYSAVANDGKMMKPYLVSEVAHADGRVITQKPKVLKSKIASNYTIKTAQELLSGVVERGTATNIQSPWIKLAGKTGTTQFDYANTQNKKTKYISSFAGYFPADEPRYSCIVVVFNPKQKDYYGSRVAAPVFKEIAESTVRLNLEMMSEFADASFDSREVLSARGYQNDITRVLSGIGLEYKDEEMIKWAKLNGRLNEDMALAAINLDDQLPDVVGLGARDAVFVLEEKGYRVRLLGSGRVSEQILRNENSTDQRVDLILE